MATTYTTNVAFAKPGTGDRNWDTPIRADLDLLDALAPIGALAVTIPASERPTSASLNVAVAAGSFRKADGTIGTYAGTATFACTTAATNSLYLTDAGTLTTSTAGFPTTGNYVPLATVVAGASTITSIADARRPFASQAGHIHWGIGTPTTAAGTGAGTSPTITITGSDQAGVLSVTAGTSPAASATIVTVTFGQAFSSGPRAVIRTPANANAAALSGAAAVYVDSANTTTAHWLLSVGSTNLTASTAYKWHYAVIG